MKPWIVAAGVLVSAPAWADRCAEGVAAEQHGDLTHAALLLEACDGDTVTPEVARAKRELAHKLDASDLAVLEVITTPQGLDATVDSLPDHLTTPVKLYVAPGKHVITVASQTITVDAKPHTRAPVYVDVKTAPPSAPHTGKIDFTVDGGGEGATQEITQPPDQQHPPLTPCKYSNSCTEAGEAIADPLAQRENAPSAYPALALELRGGSVYDGDIGPSVAFAATRASSGELPWLVSARGDWSRRDGASAFGGTLAAGKVIAASETAWLSFGAGARYDSWAGPGGVALVDLALRRLPVTVGARYEQGVTTLMDGSREHALVVELGVGWRISR